MALRLVEDLFSSTELRFHLEWEGFPIKVSDVDLIEIESAIYEMGMDTEQFHLSAACGYIELVMDIR
jgi:hypothetical protein